MPRLQHRQTLHLQLRSTLLQPSGRSILLPQILFFPFLGHGEVRVYRGTGVSRRVLRTTWERSLKNWELQIFCFEEFWGGETVLGLVPASLPDTLGYACTFYAPTFPPPIFMVPKSSVFGATCHGFGANILVFGASSFGGTGALGPWRFETPSPESPGIEKIRPRRSGLKILSDRSWIEIFDRALLCTLRGPCK